MKRYGVLGYPIKHSLSPAMHNAAFKATGIEAVYEKFEIPPEDLGRFFAGLKNTNIYGLNVTIPYKERVLDFIQLDKKSLYLAKIKAVNTLVRKGEIWQGFNTDVPGFLRHLKELGFNPYGKKIAILGAGGAGRAVSYALASNGAKGIWLFDLDKTKALSVARMVKELFVNFYVDVVDTITDLDIPNKDALINATPLGLNPDDPSPVDKKMLHKDLFIYDLVYNPPETALLRMAKSIGASCSNGLGMLLYQGMLSWEYWTGKPAPEHIMQEALYNALGL